MAKNIVTIDGIPVYQALVEADGDTGMLRISLVDDPAVQSNFLAFKKDHPEPVQLYSVQDEEKRLVLGVVMRADFPIYRRDKDGYEYYVVYKADTIRTMAEKYLVENRQNMVNTMHEKDSDVEGVQMVQYFIKGAGLSPEGFDGIADGSLFAEFHVTNDEVWDAIKAGTYKGFSLEGRFDVQAEGDTEYVKAIVEALDGKFKAQENNPKKRYNMAKFKGLMGRILRAVLEFGNVTTDKGVLAWDGEDDLKAGDAVYLVDDKGERSVPEDGTYTTADGKGIVVEGGKVSAINDEKAEAAGEGEGEGEGEGSADGRSIATDNGTLEWDGDDDLKAGDEVFITDEEGNRTAAADGDYKTEDGKTIVVVDGKVAEIKDAEAEVAPQQEQEMSRIQRIAVAFSESYTEKMWKIYEAIKGLGFDPYGYLVEAGEDFAVFETWSDAGEEKYTRFDVAWDAEGNAVVSNPTEVKPAFVPVAEEAPVPAQEFARVKGEKETAEARITELERQLAEAKQKPAAMSAHQEVQESEAGAKTGNRGLDNISRIMSAK